MHKPSGNPTGRPLLYTPEKAQKVLELYEVGDKSLRECAALCAVKSQTFLGWVVDDVDNLADRYMRVQRLRALNMRDDILPILDDSRNDWVEKIARNGETYTQLNSEHIRRSEIRAAYRERFSENMLPTKLGGKADAVDYGQITLIVDGADAQI